MPIYITTRKPLAKNSCQMMAKGGSGDPRMPEIPLFSKKPEKMAKKWHFSGGAKIPEFSGISWRVYMARRVPAGPGGSKWPTSPGAFFTEPTPPNSRGTLCDGPVLGPPLFEKDPLAI